MVLGEAHGSEDVAGGVVLGGAGGAVGDGDEVLEGEHDGLGIEAGDGDVERARQGFGGVAGDHSTNVAE